MRPILSACVAAVLLTAGCGSTTPSPTARPAPTRTAAPTPSPTPVPENQQLTVAATGVGAFDLVAVPVAVLHSEATRSTATGVVVHFTLIRGGKPIFALTSEAVQVSPGQTMVVTANCTDTCTLANGVTQVVTVSAWTPTTGTAIAVDPATYACGGSCRGRGYGDVTATLHGAGLAQNASVDIFAACATAPTTIVGGGQRSLIWPQAGGMVSIDVPVILSAQPTSCQVTATPVSSAAPA